MPGELLLDTSALVSLLDRGQTQHEDCVAVLARWTGPIISTDAVLTESTHLLGRVRRGRQICLDFCLAGGALLVPATIANQRTRLGH